ncbi:MAG: ATP synthase F1 subunit delta [Chitinophagales bacterium]
MQNPQLSSRYAKGLIDLAIKRNHLEEVYKDMKLLDQVCKSSEEFVISLKSPIIPNEKKAALLLTLLTEDVNPLTADFCRLIAKKNREYYFKEIVAEFIDQYKRLQGILKVKLTTAVPISDKLKQMFVNKVKSGTSMKAIELETIVRKEIIGGFILEFGDQMADASVAFELKNALKLFRKNDFIFRLR